MCHNLPPLLPIRLRKVRNAHNNSTPTAHHGSIKARSNPMKFLLLRLLDRTRIYLNSSGDTQESGDAVVDESVDERCSETLMFARHGVGEDDGRGGEGHVHAKGHDDDADEGHTPVDSVKQVRGMLMDILCERI